MTEKLYDENSHLKVFTATVLESRKAADGYFTLLDRTAFFPEGGGQPSDTGYINDVRVYDVQINDGVIYHYTEKPLEAGQTVTGKIDFERRFRHMQNHTGEHIISGIVHRLYGLNNTGFHLGTEMTVDFDGELTRAQLDEVEELANRAVWENFPVTAYYPETDKLEHITYRSKKPIDGPVRIVEIKNTDICACCAPHVKSTGEIGCIKILDFFKNKGGVRLFVKCGSDALTDYGERYKSTLAISEMLAVKQGEVAEGVTGLEERNAALRAENAGLKRRLIAALAAEFAAKKQVTAVFENGLDGKELQLFADALYKKAGGVRAAFSESAGGLAFAMCGAEEELSGVFEAFRAAFSVRGGGRNGIRQGTVAAEREKAEDFFK